MLTVLGTCTEPFRHRTLPFGRVRQGKVRGSNLNYDTDGSDELVLDRCRKPVLRGQQFTF